MSFVYFSTQKNCKMPRNKRCWRQILFELSKLELTKNSSDRTICQKISVVIWMIKSSNRWRFPVYKTIFQWACFVIIGSWKVILKHILCKQMLIYRFFLSLLCGLNKWRLKICILIKVSLGCKWNIRYLIQCQQSFWKWALDICLAYAIEHLGCFICISTLKQIE